MWFWPFVKSQISCLQNPSCLRLFWIRFCLNDNSGDVFPRQKEMERSSFQWLFLPGTKSTCHIKKILIALWLASYVAQLFEEVVRSSHRSSKVYSCRGFNPVTWFITSPWIQGYLVSICRDTHVISMIWCSASIIRWPAFSARAGSSSCLSPGKPNITINVQPCQTIGKCGNSITTMVIFSRYLHVSSLTAF